MARSITLPRNESVKIEPGDTVCFTTDNGTALTVRMTADNGIVITKMGALRKPVPVSHYLEKGTQHVLIVK